MNNVNNIIIPFILYFFYNYENFYMEKKHSYNLFKSNKKSYTIL